MQRAREILNSLEVYLQTLPFDFQNASIISGQEEGLYGWITVNYLMGNFLEVKQTQHDNNSKVCLTNFLK